MIAYLASSVAMALVGLVLFIYFLRKGQFDNIEEAKYQMFREDEQ